MVSLKSCGYRVRNKPKDRVCVLNRRKYGDLLLYEEKDKQRLRDNHYKFLITSGATSHTAFHTQKELKRWMSDAGIKQGKVLPHLHNSKKLIGTYQEVSLAGNQKQFNEFGKKNRLRSSKVLDNGEYTKAFIEKGKGGNRIYYLNPNYPRKKYEYKHE